MKIKENLKKFYKTNPMGISLIVLVITIIVIIILSTAIIISVIDNNPLSEANKARFQSDRDNMQSIFTNTVAKVMAVNQGSIKINPGKLNEVTSGVKSTTGVANYIVENKVDSSKASGTITFDNKANTETEYYTGKRLPIYKAGETKWYVDSEGLLLLEVGKQVYGEGKKEVEGSEGEKIEVSKDEYNALRLRVTQLEEENEKLKSELENVKKENASILKMFVDKNENVAIIPIGFYIVPGKDVVKNGLVISDVANDTEDVGNQFVWIPVENMENFKREEGYAEGYLGYAGYLSVENCGEPRNITAEVEEYNKMIESVREYHGFYVGRYELSDDGNGKAQSKKGVIPLRSIKWGNSTNDWNGGIVEKAREVYPENVATKGKVISTLIYGVAWDETVRFIKKNYPGVEKNSSGYGNYGTNVIPTGSKEEYALNNIYDMAGNLEEWTMEERLDGNNVGRITRGGRCGMTGLKMPITFRYSYTASDKGAYSGGRCQLYIK